MKNIKNYIAPLFLAVILVAGIGYVPTAEAYRGNANWGQQQNQIRNLNQIRIQDMSQEHRQLMVQLLTQLRQRLMQMLAQIDDQNWDDSELIIVTRSAADVSDDAALLRGRVADFNRSDYADVWFEYDTDRNDLDEKTSIERIDEDEDEYFERRILNLKDDTNYYFRAVGEDDEGERDYGAIVRFTTDGSVTNEDHPDVTTQSATDIRDDEVDLRGYVDMNDFNNGEVFFVYGEDEDQVEDVEDDFDTYSDVEEDGEDLQKVRVDIDLDSSDSYREEVGGLDDNTRHYVSICVGYEDDDDVLKCGSVRSFTTEK